MSNIDEEKLGNCVENVIDIETKVDRMEKIRKLVLAILARNYKEKGRYI